MLPFPFFLAFAFTPRLAKIATYVMFIGVAMAFDAIVKITDAFLNVLAADFLGCVLMAAIAGVAAVIVADVTGHALHIVIAI